MALYLPFGFFAMLTIKQGIGTAKRLVLVMVIGALLSTCMELAQYYDDGRQTAATDLYSNVVGTVLGAIGGSLAGRSFRWPLLQEIASNRVPTLPARGQAIASTLTSRRSTCTNTGTPSSRSSSTQP